MILGLHVVIAGNDRAAYSYPAKSCIPKLENSPFGESNGAVDPSRLHFPGSCFL
jgi:hypothetical protein